MNLRRGRCASWKWKFARWLRKNQTTSERAIWELVRRSSLGVRVHRQKLICGYIIDFWIPKPALAIEIDGPYHKLPKRKALDDKRDQALREIGITTLRYDSNLDPVRIIAGIKQALRVRGIDGKVQSGHN
jgi:very-short-patch-repair endonuclease